MGSMPYGGGQWWKDILLLCSTCFATAVRGLIGTYSSPLVGLDFFCYGSFRRNSTFLITSWRNPVHDRTGLRFLLNLPWWRFRGRSRLSVRFTICFIIIQIGSATN